MHDRNGTLVKVGDIVMVKAKIINVSSNAEYCNVTLSIGYEAEHGPGNVTSSVTINTKQVVLLESGE